MNSDLVFSLLEPAWLLLLIPICGLVVLIGLRNGRLSPRRRALMIGLRCLLCAMIILSLAGPGVTLQVKTVTTVFAFDLSDSVGGGSEGLDFALAAQEYMNENDRSGAVGFAANAAVEVMPGEESRVTGVESYVDSGFTDIARALELAATIIPRESMKRVVLLSDGLENSGSALEAASLLKQGGVVVDVYAVGGAVEDEAQITSLKTPNCIGMETEYEITVSIYSRLTNSATLRIYKNGTLLGTDAISLQFGENRFVYKDTAYEGGGASYRAELEPLHDTYAENNTAYSYSYVEDVPRVLVIEQNGAGAEMVSIIENSAAVAERVSAASAPETADALVGYNAVVLADVALSDLPAGFAAALEGYVKNLGGGVLVTGGGNAYALGGYADTELETLLPIDMRLKDEEELPDLGMIVLLDRSGSMSGYGAGASKLDIAKEAVIRAVDTLSDTDSFGVLAFDDYNTWPVPYDLIGSSGAGIQTRIAQITSGGGTSILPALREAVNVLKYSDVKLKHIILLTDGQAESTGYDPIIEEMSDYDITLSCVAVGDDADTQLLSRLADSGGGRYYYSDAYTDLPEIFARETDLAGRGHVNNRVFTPVVTASSDILSGISAIPRLGGYISASAKARADVILASDTDEPVLAVWQYGLGRAAAWTSDMSGNWAGEFLAAEDGVNVLKNTLSWVMKTGLAVNVALEVETMGSESILSLNTFDDGVTDVSGVLIGEDNEEIPVVFTASGPGVFTADLSGLEAGNYAAGLVLNGAEGAETAVLGVSVPYSEEYDMRNASFGRELLENIAELTGGRVLSSPEEVFTPMEAVVYGSMDISTPLMAAVLVMFTGGVLARRFGSIRRKPRVKAK